MPYENLTKSSNHLVLNQKKKDCFGFRDIKISSNIETAGCA